MSEQKKSLPPQKSGILNTAVDLTIKLGVLLLVIFLCLRILLPFTNILLWAMVIAIILSLGYKLYMTWLDTE